ncbi:MULTISPECIES: MafI family immunity protein [unclassified Streptomyces]|uniref:MafI family immunity protein n=1 Tax=unclassified Streptomyces TaxID=2593676 RepID=UPI003254EBDE
MREPHYRSVIAELLNDSPITQGEVIRNVREFLVVGEYALAFDTLCEWIYEDDLAISPAYHERLHQLAVDMDAVKLVEDLRGQIAEES